MYKNWDKIRESDFEEFRHLKGLSFEPQMTLLRLQSFSPNKVLKVEKCVCHFRPVCSLLCGIR